MGLFDFLWRLLGFQPRPGGETAPAESNSEDGAGAATPQESPGKSPSPVVRSRSSHIVLEPLHYVSSLIPTASNTEIVPSRPYRFACSGPSPGTFRDLSRDSDQRWLDYYRLPPLKTPDDLAGWLQLPIGKLAWLTHRTSEQRRAETEQKSHYVYRWIRKRRGGYRLIEAPKSELKRVQEQILRQILDHVPGHSSAHGFVCGRSVVTNVQPHLNQRFIIKMDLTDFYANVRYSRVAAIFRSLGYSREVAIWLARLTTTAIPWNLKSPLNSVEIKAYTSRHLPQGASTSPALANLSAFGLDVRLSGLARAYGLQYTRYADDLTFSGPGRAIPALREIIPLVTKIVHSERFSLNDKKRRVLRNCQRQQVTGVVVNEKTNIARPEFDRLKATLHNCIKHGPSTQNREAHADFASHLRGRIAHILQLNPQRGGKLLALFERINWSL